LLLLAFCMVGNILSTKSSSSIHVNVLTTLIISLSRSVKERLIVCGRELLSITSVLFFHLDTVFSLISKRSDNSLFVRLDCCMISLECEFVF
jgi:hypothetical protein